jgi:hydroxymethylpyrimidine pyrophosphatase-like HAD family hydrolase
MKNVENELRQFLKASSYMDHGAIVTDLDGTVLHEEQGQSRMPVSVESALKELYSLGRPLMLNTLRFPLSVIRHLGAEWYNLAGNPIPLVTMNGSQVGFIKMTENNKLIFEEVAAFPLKKPEIDEILTGVDGLLTGGIRDILVFYYPRDWRVGEVVWTPVPEKASAVREKYTSASAVTAVEFDKLRQQLQREEICMMFLLINVAEDQLMAYQHTKRSSFFTSKGVDKLSGARKLASHLGVDLAHSIGAGDTEMDQFLKGVGLALVVGDGALEFRGLTQTIRLQNVIELGALLSQLAELQSELRR